MRMRSEASARIPRKDCNDVVGWYRARMRPIQVKKMGREGGVRLGLDDPTRMTPNPRSFSSYSVVFLLCELNSSSSDLEVSLGAHLARSAIWGHCWEPAWLRSVSCKEHHLDLAWFSCSEFGVQQRTTLFRRARPWIYQVSKGWVSPLSRVQPTRSDLKNIYNNCLCMPSTWKTKVNKISNKLI